MLNVFLMLFIVGVIGTGVGGVGGVLLKKRNISSSYLYGFSGGVMLAMVLSDLVIEATKTTNIFFVICFFVVGYLLVYLVDLLAETKGDKSKILALNSKTNKVIAFIIVLSISMHNFPEGMVIGATSTKDLSVNYALMIALHNIPEGMAVAIPLLQNRVKPIKVIAICLAIGLPTIIGGLIGFLLGTNDFFVSLCLSISAGSMAYVIFNELLVFTYDNQKNGAFSIIVGIILGLMIIFGL